MARIVRQLEYLGNPEHLRTWLELSLADGVSPMFGPERQLTVSTVYSDVPGVEAGKLRRLEKHEEGGNRHEEWKQEIVALKDAVGYYLKRWPNEDINPALERILMRLEKVEV